MRLTVRVKSSARTTKVEKLEDGSLKVSVQAVPDKGKANEAVIAALADYFKVPRLSIVIAFGHKNRVKTVEIFGIDTPGV